jgi:flavin-dependent dehydrogenase
MKNEYDVIVVGGGPSGASAAKAAVKSGLRTLIIEKQKIPRNKTCSGMLMPDAMDIIKENFGDLPKRILSEPIQFHSLRFHFDSGRTYDIPLRAMIVERSEFDQWLCEKSGAEVIDEMNVTGFKEKSGGVDIICRDKANNQKAFSTSILIAADGARSEIAHSVEPDRRQKIVWYTVAQYYYQGKADLEPGYFHVFSSRDLCFYPAAYWKHDNLVLDTNVPTGDAITRGRERFVEYLSSRYGFTFDGITKKAGCMWAMPAREDLFALGTSRVLIAGDAAGFTRFLGEGITSALATGTIAGESAFEGHEKGLSPGDIYRRRVQREKRLSKSDFSLLTHLKRYESGFRYNALQDTLFSAPDLIRFSRSISRLERALIKGKTPSVPSPMT